MPTPDGSSMSLPFREQLLSILHVLPFLESCLRTRLLLPVSGDNSRWPA